MENWKGYRYPHLFRIWNAWCENTKWHQLDRWLRRYFQGQPNFGKRDRLAYANALFSAMRILQWVSAVEQVYTQPSLGYTADWDAQWHPGKVKHIRNDKFWFWVALYHDVAAPAPMELRDADSRRSWFSSHCLDAEQRQSLGLEDLWLGWRAQWNPALQARAQISQWTADQVSTFKSGQNQLPPVWLRPQQATSLDQLQDQLTAEGVLVSRLSGRLCARGGVGLLETQAYKGGLFEIQDYASQLIAETVSAKPGEKVWDACAGAGGKTLALAEQMANSGALVATDIREYKLSELKRRAKKGGYFNIRTFGWDAQAPLKLPREAQSQQGFDKVLIDAPCSSTGTWRRNPDARWRSAPLADEALIGLQQQILTTASAGVRPGGSLIYATCSWLVEENEDQVSRFLDNNRNFSLVRQGMLGFPEVDADAMFAAVLCKTTSE